MRQRFTPPVWDERGTWKHVLGTDRLGRDLLSRIIWGSRVSLTAGVLTVLLASVVGAGVGLIAGYYGGRVDTVLMRVTDATMSFPVILLALILAVTIGPSFVNVVIAIAVILWARYARVIRGQVLTLMELDFITARIAGASAGRIILRHLFPNTLNTLVVLDDSAGRLRHHRGSVALVPRRRHPPPTPAWGSMIAEVAPVTSAWWVSFFPGSRSLSYSPSTCWATGCATRSTPSSASSERAHGVGHARSSSSGRSDRAQRRSICRADGRAPVTVLERGRVGDAASSASAAGVGSATRPSALALESLGRWPISTASSRRRLATAEAAASESRLTTRAEARATVGEQRADGVPVELVDAAAAHRLAPGLSPDCRGGVHRAIDGQAEAATVGAWATAVRRVGVRIEEGVGAVSLVVEGRQGRGRRGATASACRATPCSWPRRLERPLLAKIGVKLPFHGRGLQMLLTDQAPASLTPVVGCSGRPLSLKQLADGAYLIGGVGPRAFPTSR